jgi:hypothetical protein
MNGYERLCLIQDEMLKLLEEADKIIQEDFPKHWDLAHSFWIPQIDTALRSDARWLQRGDYNMEKTLADIRHERD